MGKQPMGHVKHNSFVVFLALLWFAAANVHAAAPSFDDWSEGFAAEWVRARPQFATRAQYFSGAEQDAVDRQLSLTGGFGNTYGLSAAQAAAKLAQSGLTELRHFPVADMTPQQRTSAAVIDWTLQNAIRRAEFAQNRLVFDQFDGLQVALVTFMTTTHPIRNRRDAENYLARLALVGPLIDQGVDEAKAAAVAGIIPPRFIIERVIDQLNQFTAISPADNVFVTTFDTRLAALGAALPPVERANFVAAAEKETRETVLPAFARIRTMLEEQLPKATDDAGVWRLPRGDAFYAQALNTSTTTTLSADEIHAIGLREVARIEAAMDVILKRLGYPDGSVKDRYEKFNATLQLPVEPDPRPILVARADAIVQDAARRSVTVFDLRPNAPVTVKREPTFSERGAAAHYSAPAPDGTLPGIYWIPLADLGPKVTWLGAGMKSTAYHEAIPGHHFQVAIQLESNELPRYRKFGVFGSNSAFGEGWGLYGERLAEENGWYDDDLTGQLGFLQLQLFRARRLVADTGLHAKHWTRQQVIDYGFTEAETDRYIVNPGQACSYMIGQLKIVELREKAKQSLGTKFSIKEFHNVVLRGGSVPLDVLAQEIDAWVAANR
jgi:uncharacterized protein (DUF885 family)